MIIDLWNMIVAVFSKNVTCRQKVCHGLPAALRSLHEDVQSLS